VSDVLTKLTIITSLHFCRRLSKTEPKLSFHDREAALFLAILSSYLAFNQTLPVIYRLHKPCFVSQRFWSLCHGWALDSISRIWVQTYCLPTHIFWSNSYNKGQNRSVHHWFNNSILEKLISKQCMYHVVQLKRDEYMINLAVFVWHIQCYPINNVLKESKLSS